MPREGQGSRLNEAWLIAKLRLHQSVLLTIVLVVKLGNISLISLSLSWNPYLASWSRILHEEVIVPQLVKSFCAVYGMRKFITALTTARRLSLSSLPSPQQNPIALNSISALQYIFKVSLNSSIYSTSRLVACLTAKG